ncbi:TSC22 domain family protein 2 isoform X1 [Ictalurus punctatus]|uniref:TSC22 domain family protein 3 n=1 Tax=Ictalurus punctatus TaxID=7998 RepID=A0A9F7RLB0_ICTPU|nr:TSC22 domain family protein 2 isoform X1 [Ictalurus punctatus]
MFGSVRKMVSAFETRKQPCPPPPTHSSLSSSIQNPSPKQSPPPSTTPSPVIKTLPCLSTTPEPHPSHTSGQAPSTRTILHPVMSVTCHDGERERQDVVLRGGGQGRRIPRVRLRDSWPMGKLNCFERNFLSFVTVETKEPISCGKCPPEFDRGRLRPIRCKSTSVTGLNTISTSSAAGLSAASRLNATSSAAGLNATSSTAGLNAASGFNAATSAAGLNAASSAAGLNAASSAAGLNATSAAGLNATSTSSTSGLNATFTTELNANSAAGLNANSITRPKSTTGTNISSSASTTLSVTRGAYSHLTTETSSRLTPGASANANVNSDSELLLSLGRRGPGLVGGANKSAFEPPGVPVYPKQLVLGSTTVTQSGGRGQGKGQAFQPQLGLRPSDSTFFSLLLLSRSGSSNSMIAIDNKIEQAMDLVKAHLMLAVREEVEVLREQIKELAERNAQLERENYILRALRENQ